MADDLHFCGSIGFSGNFTSGFTSVASGGGTLRCRAST